MTTRELKPILSSVRLWLVEIGHTLPPQFAEYVAIVTGELAKRVKEEDAESVVLDN